MRLSYRQGLVGAPSGYLQISNGSINLVVSQVPVIATAAFEYANYLIGEYSSVAGAWGPFSGSTTQYLYWQINQTTGAVTRGSTSVLPISSGTAPSSPTAGQIWWDTTNTTMFIWNGTVWQPTILVFAATLASGATLEYYNGAAPGVSQVGLDNISPPINAGYVLTDNYGGVFQDQSGYLLTTETSLISQDTGSQVKLDGALVVVTTYGAPIAAFTLVYLNEGFATPASSDPVNYQTQAPIAMITEPAPANSAVALVQAGRMVINTAWSWTPSQFGSPVYVSSDGYGTLTTTKPVTAKYVRVGTIVGANSVFLSFDWETDLPSATVISGVSEIFGSSPVTIAGSLGYPVVEIQPVSTSQPGYLGASDYTSFLAYATNKVSTAPSATVGDVATWTTGGQLLDSGVLLSSLATNTNLALKADKVTGATANNFAGLTSGGNLTDSGYNAGSFATLSTVWPQSNVTGLPAFITATNASLAARVNTAPSATSGDIATWTTGGQLLDSGVNISILSSKIDMVSGAVVGNFPAFTNTGDVSDSGYSYSAFAPAVSTASAITSLNTSVSTINTALANKADKVTSPTANDFAALNSGGDLIDSGYNSSSFAGATATTNALNTITGNVTSLTTALGNKVDKPTVTTAGDFTSLLSNGDIADSGFNSGSFIAINSNNIAQSQILGLGTSLNSKVNRSGDTMTGSLTVPSFAVGSVFSVLSSGEIDLNGSAGTAGQVLTSQGSGAIPTWSTVSSGGGGSSSSITLTQVSNNQNYYLTFAAAQAGNQDLYATGAPSFYNPGTNTFTVGSVVATGSGGFQGNATSATNATTATNIAGGAAGSIPYQTAANTTSELAIGTTGQVLTVSAGLPAWENAASFSAPTGQLIYGTGSGTTSSSSLTFDGTIFYAGSIASSVGLGSALSLGGSSVTITTTAGAGLEIDGAGAWHVASNVGSAGQVLTSNGTGAAPTWNSSVENISGGVSGSLPYQSAANSTMFIGIGSAGKVLTSNGSVPSWETPTSSAAGSNGQIQFNLNGNFGADPNLSWANIDVGNIRGPTLILGESSLTNVYISSLLNPYAYYLPGSTPDTFTVGDTITQANTGATAQVLTVDGSGTFLDVTPLSGDSDATDVWTNTGGSVWTPTAAPLQSNGTVTTSLGTSPTEGEGYDIAFISATEYTVFDVDADSSIANGTVGVQYTTPSIVWTINAGSVPFQVGDSFDILLEYPTNAAQITDTTTGLTASDYSGGINIIGQTSGNPGQININGGEGINSGGEVSILGGTGYYGGALILQGGQANSQSGGAYAGSVNIAGGQGNNATDGGNLFLSAGNAAGTGNAGSVVISGGYRYAGPSSSSGSITLQTGVGVGYPQTALTIDGYGTFLVGPSENSGTAGQVLTSGGAETPPTWSSVSVDSGDINFGITGQIASLGSLVGGSGYNGPPSPYLLQLIGGSGTGATAIITFPSGSVTNVEIASPGSGYQVGNVLSIPGVGGGSGFSITVESVTSNITGYVAYGSGTSFTGSADLVFENSDSNSTLTIGNGNQNYTPGIVQGPDGVGIIVKGGHSNGNFTNAQLQLTSSANGTAGDGGQASLIGGSAALSGVGGSVTISSGGGAASGANGSVLFQINGTTVYGMPPTGDFQIGTSSGTSGQVFTSGGAGAPPTWSAVEEISGPNGTVDTSGNTGSGIELTATDTQGITLWASITSPNGYVEIAVNKEENTYTYWEEGYFENVVQSAGQILMNSTTVSISDSSNSNISLDQNGYMSLSATWIELTVPGYYSGIDMQEASMGIESPGGGTFTITDPNGSTGSLGQVLQSNGVSGTGASTAWTNLVDKQLISATGADTIAASNCPKIFVALSGSRSSEDITFPTAAFDGQIIAVKFNGNFTSVSYTVPGGTLPYPLSGPVGQGQYVEYIWDATSFTWN